MRWNAKITDTAKASYERRGLLLDKIEVVIASLKTIRCRAIKYASPEAIGAIVPEIELPRQSSREMDEIKDVCKRSDFPWLIEKEIQLKESILLELLQRRLQNDNETFRGLEDSWFEDIVNAPDDTDQFAFLALLYPAEDDSISLEDHADIDSDESNYDQSFIWDDDVSSPESVEDVDQTNDSNMNNHLENEDDLNEENFLLTPWERTFAVRLSDYLDELDGRQAHEPAIQPPPGFGHGADLEYITSAVATIDLDACGTLDISKTQEPLVYSQTSLQPPPYPVTTAHLMRFQRDFRQVLSFRAQICKTMYEVRDSMDRRHDRYRMRESNGDITMVMRSRGYGSPLVEVTSIDDESDGDEEEANYIWDLPPRVTSRRKLYRSPKTTNMEYLPGDEDSFSVGQSRACDMSRVAW